MQSCNGRQAVMSALEDFVLAGKVLNAFSVLLLVTTAATWLRKCLSPYGTIYPEPPVVQL
jgi:hypothetical protein